MEFTRRPIPSDLAINLNGTQLRKVKEQRHLGLIRSSDLRWTEHTNRVCHVDLAKHPFTYFTCGEAIAEVGHLELIFTSCPCDFQSALVGFHLANQTAPPHLQEVCYPRASVDHSLRHHNFFQLPKANCTLFQSSPLYFASHIFNILPKHIQSSTRLSEFKKKAQQYFLSPSCPCSMHVLTSM